MDISIIWANRNYKNIFYIYTYTNFNSDGIYVIIATKNQEERIEGFCVQLSLKFVEKKKDQKHNINRLRLSR